MKQQFIILTLAFLILSGCSSTRHSTAGSDDVYSRAPVEILTQAPEQSQDERTYPDNNSYGTYDENADGGYSSYSSRILRFEDPYLTYDYYSPFYANPFSIGFSWSSGCGYPYYSWGFSMGYGSYPWYNGYMYNCPYSYYNPWGYYPAWPYNYYWGWNPWYYGYPWYYNEPPYYYPYHGSNNYYYGPRKWGGSNTNNNYYRGSDLKFTPSAPYIPGNYNNYGKSTTPSGIEINKGSKTGNPAPQSSPNSPAQQSPQPSKGVKYYKPGSQPVDTPPNVPSNQSKPTQSSPIKYNKGTK